MSFLVFLAGFSGTFALAFAVDFVLRIGTLGMVWAFVRLWAAQFRLWLTKVRHPKQYKEFLKSKAEIDLIIRQVTQETDLN